MQHPDNLIRGFTEALQDCDLFDLGMVGHAFTWEKGRGSDHWVEERLDRAVATTDWCSMFNDASVRNILTLTSDHSAIFLNPDKQLVRRGGRRFKFESAWLVDENCKQVVEHSWSVSIDR